VFVSTEHCARVNRHEIVGGDRFIHVRVLLSYTRYIVPFLCGDQLKQVVTAGLTLFLLQEQVVGTGHLVMLVILHELFMLLCRTLDDITGFRIGGRRQTRVESKVIELAENVRQYWD